MRNVLAAMLVAAIGSTAWSLEIPLTVTERAGADRIGNHVSSGIPLPRGVYKDVDKFTLYTAGGQPVPAQFVVRERWLQDDSVQFMTVHFATDLKANQSAGFVVRDDGKAAAPTKPVAVIEDADSVTVDSGAVRFTVAKGDWHLFDAVQAGATDLLAKPGEVVFKAEYGRTPVSGGMAAPPPEGEVRPAKAVVNQVVVEEKTPGRAVVLVVGSFQDEGQAKLDFQARYYALAASPAVRVVFTVINRQGSGWDQFVGLRSLGFELPVKLDGPAKFAVGASEGDDLVGQLAGDEKVVMLQPSSVSYSLSGKVQGAGKCKALDTKRVGWISLAGKDVGLTAAVRYFWQTHPKGLAVTGDGTVKVYLVPPQQKKVEVPADEYSEPLTRIDLYTGGAKTHEMLFTFGAADAAAARSSAMGVIEPLFAACPTDWYCHKTWAFGPIYDARLENFRPEVRELVRAYEVNVDRSFTTVMARRSGKEIKAVPIASALPITEKDPKTGQLRNTVYIGAQKCEEYGWLNFGSHVEHGDKVTPGDALNTQWDGNYYDFPRACLVRFVRTGLADYLDSAQQAGLHLADIEITHCHTTNPKLAGIERVCPDVGHFRTFWPGRAFQPSGNVHSAKSQSLYELYYLTGDMWYKQAGLLSGEYLYNHTGGNVRGMGNRITGLLCAYRASRNEKFKKAWLDDVISRTAASAIRTNGKAKWDQAWQYGLGVEALRDCWALTGNETAAKGVKFAADSLINAQWSAKELGARDSLAGFTVNVYGAAYEVTGDASYLRAGLKALEHTSRNYAGRSKSFAQMARISPQFLYYLAGDYAAPKPAVGDKEKADPVEQAFKAAPAEQPKPPTDVGEL